MAKRLADYNLIKKLLIGFMFSLLCVVGVSFFNPTTAKAELLKNKTFIVESKYPIKISDGYNTDKDYDSWTDNWETLGKGTISWSGKRVDGGYIYTIVMDDCDVAGYTPYLNVTAAVDTDESKGWYAGAVDNASAPGDYQYGDKGSRDGAHKVDNLGDAGKTVNYHEQAGHIFIYIGYEFVDSHIVVNWLPYTYQVKYNPNNGQSYSSPEGKANWYYGGYGYKANTYGKTYYPKSDFCDTYIPYADSKIQITGTYDNIYGTGAGYLPTMSGYDFKGWQLYIDGKYYPYDKKDGIWQNGDWFDPRKLSHVSAWNGRSNCTFTIEFKAVWEEKPYHIIYYTNESAYEDKWYIGNAPTNWNPSNAVSYVATSSSLYYDSGKTMDKTGYYPSGTANLITNPYQLFGWHFTGWNTQSNGGGIKYNAGQKGLKAGTSKGLLPITTDTYGNKVVKLYAMWSPNIYRAILNDNGGSGGTGTIYEKYDVCFTSDSNGNHKLDSVNIPVREHMDFDGYYTSKDGGTKVINSNGTFVMKPNTFTGYDSVYYAHWKPSVYQITLHKNGGGDNETIYEKYTVNIYNEKSCKNVKSKVGVPSRTNYTFVGYYTEDNFYKKAKSIGELSGAQVIDKNGNYIGSTKTLVNKDTHLYAAWIPNVYTITLDNQIPSLAEEIQKGSTKVYERYSICYYMNTNVMFGSEESHQVTGWSNNRGWAYFTAPATGTYTFYGSDGSNSQPYTLQEGETIMLYTRIEDPK